MRRTLGFALVGYASLLFWARISERRVVWAAERLLFDAVVLADEDEFF